MMGRMANRAACRDGQTEGAWGEAPPRDDWRFATHDSRRAVRRAAALLITALAVKAIRNKARHCPQDGAFLDKDGDCHSPKHGGTKGESAIEGHKGKCSRQEAEQALNDGFSVKSSDGRSVRFDRFARDHYAFGQRRKDNTPKPENLEWLPAAIHAVKHGERTLKFPDGTTPDYLDPPPGTQAVYAEHYGRHTLKAYVYHNTGKVSGWHFE